MIGYALCGSFCTVGRSLTALEELTKIYEVLPVFSPAFAAFDTRFGNASGYVKKVEELCGRRGVTTITEAEPIGPAIPLEALVIAPCTGNTLAKLACSITDTAVTMAAKAHLRNLKPLVIALATNDALSANLRNIGVMLARKNVYFVPLGQDDAFGKPSSLVCDFNLIDRTLSEAIAGRQLQPLLL